VADTDAKSGGEYHRQQQPNKSQEQDWIIGNQTMSVRKCRLRGTVKTIRGTQNMQKIKRACTSVPSLIIYYRVLIPSTIGTTLGTTTSLAVMSPSLDILFLCTRSFPSPSPSSLQTRIAGTLYGSRTRSHHGYPTVGTLAAYALQKSSELRQLSKPSLLLRAS